MINFQKVDRHVGQRVRHRRMLLGISQTKLANALDVSFQQVQKYEKGSNPISASKLLAISQLLERPVGYFFEDAPVAGRPTKLRAPDDLDISDHELERVDVRKLLRHYLALDPALQNQISTLVRQIDLANRRPATAQSRKAA